MMIADAFLLLTYPLVAAAAAAVMEQEFRTSTPLSEQANGMGRNH
jgi:hypothetical protein